MLEFLIYCVIALVFAALAAQWKLEQAWSFLFGVLLGFYCAFNLLPISLPMIAGFLPEEDRAWAPLLALGGVGLVLMIVLFVIFSLLPPPKLRVSLPEQAAKPITFLCVLFGGVICVGVLTYGFSPLAHVDKWPVISHSGTSGFSRIALSGAIRLVQCGEGLSPRQKLYLEEYPEFLYRLGGGSDVRETAAEGEKQQGAAAEEKQQGAAAGESQPEASVSVGPAKEPPLGGIRENIKRKTTRKYDPQNEL